MRTVDLRVSRLTAWFVRYVYPLVGAWALIQRRRNQWVVEQTAGSSEPTPPGSPPPRSEAHGRCDGSGI